MSHVSEKELADYVRFYKLAPALKTGKMLGNAFIIMLDNMLKVFKKSFIEIVSSRDLKRIKKRCLFRCFNTVDKYDDTKGGASSYFYSIMLNHLKGEYRAYKNEQEQEVKYGKFIA